MAKFVRGTCEDFCPEREVKLRYKEHLLHFYELKNGRKDTVGIPIKSFSRSAAGHRRPEPQDLRTELCLQRTIDYLLKDILMDTRKPFHYVYDFIFDRLRAVRQEIVMQNFDAHQAIKLLEPMILFLAFSRYKLCEESMDNFDPKICDQHLQECLKRVLCCYDEVTSSNNATNNTIKNVRNRIFIESIYQLFNLGSMEPLRRYIQLPKNIRSDPVVYASYSIGLSYLQGNIYRVLIGIKSLPHILCAVSSLRLQAIRRRLYQMFAYAFNSKHLSVPADFLCRIMHYSTESDLLVDIKFYNLHTSEDRKNIYFIKSDFKADVGTPKEKHEYIVEEKLKRIYLPEVLLLKRL